MKVLGVSADEQRALWHVLGAIYHLGAAGATKCKISALTAGFYILQPLQVFVSLMFFTTGCTPWVCTTLHTDTTFFIFILVILLFLTAPFVH